MLHVEKAIFEKLAAENFYDANKVLIILPQAYSLFWQQPTRTKGTAEAMNTKNNEETIKR